MKKLTNILTLFALIALTAFSPVIMNEQAMAQRRIDLKTFTFYYTSTLGSSVTYTANKKDTLPSGSTSSNIGGSSLLTLCIQPHDTASFDIFVDKQTRGLTTWTNILTDSLINTGQTSNSGTIQEYVLRNTVTDKVLGLYDMLRVRVNTRSSGNGTSSNTYDAWWDFRP